MSVGGVRGPEDEVEEPVEDSVDISWTSSNVVRKDNNPTEDD